MGFLDKLLGRKKSDAEGMQTAPPAPTMPSGDTPEHSHGEGEHTHEQGEDEGSPGGGTS